MPVDMPERPTNEQLIRTHQRDVWRFLVAIGCDHHEADDLTQEAFIRVLEGNFQYRGEPETAAWLRKTARHLFLTRVRKQSRTVPVADVETLVADWEQYQAAMPEDERIAWLRECLEALGERAREALSQRYALDLSRDEMARRLGLEPTGVRTLLERARRALRECVEKRRRHAE
jgi:RNA polymerase sigma-70 factor, ECF subfamily